MLIKNRKKKYYLILSVFLILVYSSCKKNDTIKITNWDNSKYMDWESSVGLDVYNLNSSNSSSNITNKTNKENSVIYITNLEDPLFIDFNNNGKDRNFIMSVFYDYEQIPFKVTEKSDYSENYIFSLEDSKEIKLPLYLPSDLIKSDNHKLLISISIGYDTYAKDLETQSDWYGINRVYDLTYEADISNFKIKNDDFDFIEPSNTINSTYSFNLNEDFDYSIINTNVMLNVNKMIEVKKGKKFKLVYNASTIGSDTRETLILLTFNYLQTDIDNYKYKLLNIPQGKTGIGTIELTAPNEIGLYEIIGLLVYNPYKKINENDDFNVDSSVRFTLNVID